VECRPKPEFSILVGVVALLEAIEVRFFNFFRNFNPENP